MVQFLTGNYVLWDNAEDQGYNTVFDGGFKTKSWQLSNLDPRTINPPKQIANMTLMNFGGTFQGMIFHLNVNQLPDDPVTFEFIKTTGFGTVIVDTGVKCIIQRDSAHPDGTGFFYSNTNIAEFTRTWTKGEFIQVHQTKSAATSFAGSGPGTLQILLDLDIPPPIPP